MTLELIVFIASLLFGAFLYWRESQSNRLYRFFNKLLYSKELQMKTEDKKGFVYQQQFFLRFISISFLFLIGVVITRFLIPIDLATLSLFASMIAGTVLGTYLAGFIFKSTEVIDDKSDSLEDLVKDSLEKGKDFIDELKHQKEPTIDSAQQEEAPQESSEPSETEAPKKSARERLKDKGYLK